MYFWGSPCSIPRLQLVTGKLIQGDTTLPREGGQLYSCSPPQNSPGVLWYCEKTVWSVSNFPSVYSKMNFPKELCLLLTRAVFDAASGKVDSERALFKELGF